MPLLTENSDPSVLMTRSTATAKPRTAARETGQARRGARDARGDLGWFSEGFDTAYLKEAKALLDELRE